MTKWRLIKLESNSAAVNMALDEACLNHVAAKKSPPTIRFYRWTPSAISIGFFQNVQREVDIEKCKKENIDIVRRQTGGGAVYHDAIGELTYSIIAPLELFSGNIIESYRQICGYIIEGLKSLGLKADFAPINDIIINGKKVSGNAQTRKKGVLLQHGTILYRVDLEKMFNLLKVPDEKIKEKMLKSAKERVTSIADEKREITFNDLLDAMYTSFFKDKNYIKSNWSESEFNEARLIAANKYLQKDWTHRV